tara:strand:+ start:24793 stop:25269 length:477 start_codon:yes stop_codon:yes gene_type:complete
MDLNTHGAVVDTETVVDSELITAGNYNVEIVSSEGKSLGNNNGILCEFLVRIIDSGKLFSDGFWVAHDNPKSVEIGLGNLAKFAKACGHSGVLKNTDVLNGKKLNLEVELNDKGYPQFKNNSFKPFEENEEVNVEKTVKKAKTEKASEKTVNDEDIPF